MAKILYLGTHAADDAGKAVLPLVAAKGAIDAGHQATLALIGEGVWLMRDVVAENVRGVGWPSVKELLSAIVAARVPVYI